jgi:hypothetical protein
MIRTKGIEELKRSQLIRITYSYAGGMLIVIAIIAATAYWTITKDWRGDIFDRILAEQTTHQTVPILIALGGLLIGGIVVLIGFIKTSGDRAEKKDGPHN